MLIADNQHIVAANYIYDVKHLFLIGGFGCFE